MLPTRSYHGASGAIDSISACHLHLVSSFLKAPNRRAPAHAKAGGHLLEAGKEALGIGGGVGQQDDIIRVPKVGKPLDGVPGAVGDLAVGLVIGVEIVLDPGAPLLRELLQNHVHAENERALGGAIILK